MLLLLLEPLPRHLQALQQHLLLLVKQAVS
jgi:hypothetical protein